MRVSVALGTVFQIGLQKGGVGGIPLQGVFSDRTTSVTAPQYPIKTATVMPKVVPLFPDRAIIRVDNSGVAPLKEYVAIHLGTAEVTVTPIAEGPVTKFTIAVIAPTGLGSTLSYVDEYYSNVAHNSGIPPQYLKGQGRQESRGRLLAADNWRYELCTDANVVYGRGVGLVFTDPNFVSFRLDDAIGATLHPDEMDEIDPRDIFWILGIDPQTQLTVERRIIDTATFWDTQVTARNLWDHNDSNPRHTHYNWSSASCDSSTLALINAPKSTFLDFVAQTPTASSSGYQQVMWEEAAKPRYWDGVMIGTRKGVKEPKYIFDRPQYIEKGGGSIQIAANKLATMYAAKTRTAFDSFAEYEATIDTMFRHYNWAWQDPNTGLRYGAVVVQRSRHYAPAQATGVFQ